MIERLAVLLSCLMVVACADAHDVDAVTPNLRGDDAGSDEGASSGTAGDDGASGSGNVGSGTGGAGSGSSSTAGSGSTSNAGSGTGTSGTGSGSAGTPGGGTGQPVFGNVSSCAPCSGAMGSMGELEPCCTADGECGLDIGAINGLGRTCAQQNAPGTESMSCPAYVFNGNFDLTSCCGADGFCGVMIMQTAPLGCVDPALLGDLVEPAEGMMSGGGSMFGGGMRNQGDDEGPVRCRGGLD